MSLLCNGLAGMYNIKGERMSMAVIQSNMTIIKKKEKKKVNELHKGALHHGIHTLLSMPRSLGCSHTRGSCTMTYVH